MNLKPVSVVRFSITAVIVLIAALIAWLLWNHYMYSGWTRDARVRADVVQVAPDVSGPVVSVAVEDNDAVDKGDVLFRIDPTRYEHHVNQAEANLDAAQNAVNSAKAKIKAAEAGVTSAHASYVMQKNQAARRQNMEGAVSREASGNARDKAAVAKAKWQSAKAQKGEARAARKKAVSSVEQARARLAEARLDLARTKVRAPRDGHVTNLELYTGDYVGRGKPAVALVARNSFSIYGYFEETKLPKVSIGDSVDIRMMNDIRLKGRVESIARGISDAENPRGGDLLAHVSPSFSWVRLAQRIPVKIHIDPDSIPDDAHLAAGMTATVTLNQDDD